MPGLRFIQTFLASVVAAAGALLLLLLALDPFATGRLTPFTWSKPAATAPRMATAHRLADPQYTAAIIGNSTAQLLNPARLDAQTGLRFVQLSIPGTGPMEQRAVALALTRNRQAGIKAVVLGADVRWCDARNEQAPLNPFPFWLYSANNLEYLKGMFRLDSVDALPRRLMGQRRGRDPMILDNGFWDFELQRHVDPAKQRPPEISGDAPVLEGRQQAALGVLTEVMAALPRSAALVVLFPPAFLGENAPPFDKAWPALHRCKQLISDAVSQRMGSAVIDQLVPSEITRVPANFHDFNHYRGPIAERLEIEISQKISLLRALVTE